MVFVRDGELQVPVALRTLDERVLAALADQAEDSKLSEGQRDDAFNLRLYLKKLRECFTECLIPKGRAKRGRITNADEDLKAARGLCEFARDWIASLEQDGEASTTKKFLAWQVRFLAWHSRRSTIRLERTSLPAHHKTHPGAMSRRTKTSDSACPDSPSFVGST